MITVTVEKNAKGKYKVADQATGEVYGYTDSKDDVVDLVRDKTGDLDVTVLAGND